MEHINTIASYCGSISAIIALVVLVVKPIRNKFVDLITKTSNRDELNTKIDNLTELVEKQVAQNEQQKIELEKQSDPQAIGPGSCCQASSGAGQGGRRAVAKGTVRISD